MDLPARWSLGPWVEMSGWVSISPPTISLVSFSKATVGRGCGGSVHGQSLELSKVFEGHDVDRNSDEEALGRYLFGQILGYVLLAVVWEAKMLRENVSWCVRSPRLYSVAYLSIDVQRNIGKSCKCDS
jgi:hypothetical protein